MKLEIVSANQAVGKLLAHNIVDDSGRKILRKGTPIGPAEVARLQELGYAEVWIAELGLDDVPEDKVARRLADAVCGAGVDTASLSVGRANLQASQNGILKVALDGLRQINGIPGLAIATRRQNSVVQAGHTVATLKVVPYAMPAADVERAVAIAQDAESVLAVWPFKSLRVGVILTGDPASEDRVRRVYGGAIRERVEATGSKVVGLTYLPEDVSAIAAAIQELSDRTDMVVMAGATSIVDADDVVPRAIHAAGGELEIYGVPVDPGNLLMLSYVGQTPVIGAPGCVRSRTDNVVDFVLPRLLAGERLTREDIIELGHGGLMG
jgi:molybdenum cofactor cytidylyltransferase